MKRKAGWIALVVLTLLLGWMWRPVLAQLKYAALSVAQTFTDIQTFSGGFKRPTIQIKEVCPSGCEFATVTAALAAITDSSSTKRYTVLIYPADYDETVTMKSYVGLVGLQRDTVRLRGVDANGTVIIPVDVTGTSYESLTIGGRKPLLLQGDNTVRTVTTVTNAILGITDGTENAASGKSIDGVIILTALADYTNTNVICRSIFDCVNIGPAGGDPTPGNGVNYTENGQVDELLAQGQIFVRAWSFIGGHSVFINGTQVTVTKTSSISQVRALHLTGTLASGANRMLLTMLNASIFINDTQSASSTNFCFNISSSATSATPSYVNIIGSDCIIIATSASGTPTGVDVVNDADHSNWTLSRIGGSDTITGGASQRNVNQADTTGGFVFNYSGVKNAGLFTGAGVITGANTSHGQFGTSLIGPARDLSIGSCVLGETAVDSGGATVERCVCGSGNVWACWNLATGAFNANGPVD